MVGFEQSPLYRIMHPASVAFWGASSNPMGMGTVQLSQMLALGFEGPVYPMHPREQEILGLKAYPHLKEVPGPVDLAVLVIPTKVVPEILEECGKSGVTRAIIVSAGFGEKGSDGQELQNRIVEIARKYGIHFIGPNCIGVVNPYSKLNTTFFPYEATPGFIGMASQSGSFITQVFVHLEKFGLGFSQGFSVGNEAMTDITDCLEYLGQCPDTKVIALYIEGVRRGRDFFRVAREVSKRKPIVAYYIGGSESGKRAALSHTGALAGPDPLYDGIFRQCGILRAASVEELFDMCCVLGSQPLPKGNGLAVLTHSGGPGAAAADTAERNGLRLASLSSATSEGLSALVPHTASIGNPVDLTFNRNPSDYTEAMPRILLQDPNVHNLFMYLLIPIQRVAKALQAMGAKPGKATAMAEDYIDDQCAVVAELSARYGKPVVGASFCTRDEPFVRELQDSGVPVLPSPERAIKALAALVKYAAIRDAIIKEDSRAE
ncbi:MAG: acetate--CoA ligase family protein [Desulfomonilaceae bacterium]